MQVLNFHRKLIIISQLAALGYLSHSQMHFRWFLRQTIFNLIRNSREWTLLLSVLLPTFLLYHKIYWLPLSFMNVLSRVSETDNIQFDSWLAELDSYLLYYLLLLTCCICKSVELPSSLSQHIKVLYLKKLIWMLG